MHNEKAKRTAGARQVLRTLVVLTSGTVGSHEGHTGIQINAKVNVAVQQR